MPAPRDRSRWKWLLAAGVLLVVLGIVGGSLTAFLDVTSLFVFGPILLASSGIQLCMILSSETGLDRLRHLVAAGVEVVVGLAIIGNPVQNQVSLLTWIAILLIVGGLIRLLPAFAMPSRRRLLTGITGAIAIILGISIWMGWPASKLLLVGLWIAIDFVCHGIAWSAIGMLERGSQAPGAPTA
jgi:uncharacterized membrane protein HdeD (DUF308 family)